MRRRTSRRSQFTITALFLFAAGFSLPGLAGGDSRYYLLAAAVSGVLLLFPMILGRIFTLDLPAVSVSLVLCAFSILSAASSSPDAAVTQALHVTVGLIAILAGSVLSRSVRVSVLSATVFYLCGCLFLSLPMWFPSLPFSLGGVASALLLVAFAMLISQHRLLPALLVMLSGIFLLFLQKETLFSVIWGCSCILIFWTAAGSTLWSCISLVSAAGLVIAEKQLVFSSVLSDSAQSAVVRLRSMGLIGPVAVPEGSSASGSADSLFLSLGDQYGVILLICIVLLMILLLCRCYTVARSARKAFHASVALGVLLLLGLKILCCLLSVTELIPDLYTDLPFMTAFFSDLTGHMLLLGLLCGVSARNQSDLEEDAHLAMLSR